MSAVKAVFYLPLKDNDGRDLTAEIEQRIQDVLNTESQAVPLSMKLFGPDGLFSQLATTQESRRKVARSALFQKAQRRLTQLQQQEVSAFRPAITRPHAEVP